MSTDLETNLQIIEEFTQRLQVAVVGAEETTAKHEDWLEGPVDGVIETENGPLKSLRGQIEEWRLAADQDVSSAIDGYDLQFTQAIEQFQDEFEAYLFTIGFEPAVEYVAGIVISRRSQTVVNDGVTYYWVSELPYTTTGDFSTELSWQIAPIVGGIEVPGFNFLTGGKLLRKTQSVLGLDGEWYYWTGSFPKEIPASSTLESAGGVGQNLFKLVSGFPPLRPSLKILVSSMGLTLNSGSFESGAVLVGPDEVLSQFLTGKLYKWGGAFPKNVDLFSTPESSGGVDDTAWVEVERSFTKSWAFEGLRRTYKDAGLTLAPGSFEQGGTITNSDGVLFFESNGRGYSWSGVLPKVVPPLSTPESTGGFVDGWVDRSDLVLRGTFEGPNSAGLEDFYGGGGWGGSQAGSANLQGPLHINAMRWRYDIKASSSLDPIVWIEKETVANVGDTSSGDTGWDGGAGYFAVKKPNGTANLNVLTGYARHNGGSGGMIGVLGRGSGQHIDSEVWGVWAYAEIGFGAISSGVQQAIALESNTCNRGPDKGWMPATGPGSARGVLSITADGTNRCTHAFYTGNHRASGGTPGVGGWWTGYLVGANSIAANVNSSTTYVGDGEGYRINGSGSSSHSYGGFRFYNGFYKYGTSYIEGSYVNNAAILMGPGKRIIWGAHAGSSRHMDYDETNNWLSVNNMGLAMSGVKVLGPRATGIFQLTGTPDGTSKNTETMTLVELARYVKKGFDALINHGMIGPT